MPRLRIGFTTAAAAAVTTLPLLLGACGSAGSTSPARAPETTASTQAQSSTPSTATTQPPSQAAKQATEKDFNRNNFDRSTNIDNQWFPLKPGKQLVYDGETKVDGKRVRHRVVFTVTDLTKVVDGVRSVVVWDRDYTEGQLVETELAFFAQDNDGNVWHLGQYPEEYEEGKLAAAPAWIAGREGAKPGISMRADPRVRTSGYSQGFGPKVNWTDRARVSKTGQKTCVPAGCYEGVLVTDENTRDEPDAHQLKYYARGVGNVRVGWAGRDEEQETLVLVKVVQLSPAALAEVRRDALKLEQRAYAISKNVYGHTPPAE